MLARRDYGGRTVLEFGGGQSTLWWATRAARVITIETDPEWHAEIAKLLPDNVELALVRVDSEGAFLAEVVRILHEKVTGRIDVIVIDADHREALIGIALNVLADDGAMICDDAESYGFYEATKALPLQRVDFFGFSPGVVLPHCTSIYFSSQCFLFSAKFKIPDVGVDRL